MYFFTSLLDYQTESVMNKVIFFCAGLTLESSKSGKKIKHVAENAA